MNPRSSIADRHTYIPPQAESAINQHLQQNLPAHLKPFMDANRTGYVPPQVQAEISKSLDTMPEHLRQYTGAYVQQRVAQPRTAQPAGPAEPGFTPHAPIPDHLRLDHSMPVGQQYTVQPETLSPANNLFPPDNPAPAGGSQPPLSNYEFITDPPPPSRRRLFAVGGGSLGKRLLLACGGLLVLIIIIVFVKSLLGGSPSFATYTLVTQDQQELIHLSANATQQQGISTTNQNFAITAQLSLTSAQTQLIAYLKDNHQEISAKILDAKVSTTLDSQLTTAASDSTYDATFQQIIQNQLASYEQALSQAYKTAGPNGKKLLSADYSGAQLLFKQLSAPAS